MEKIYLVQGGWSSVLSERVAHITAIDPGALKICKPNVRHMKCIVEEAIPVLHEEGKIITTAISP